MRIPMPETRVSEVLMKAHPQVPQAAKRNQRDNKTGRTVGSRQSQSDFAEGQFMRRDDAHAAVAGGDEDEFGATVDDADLEGRDEAASASEVNRPAGASRGRSGPGGL